MIKASDISIIGAGSWGTSIAKVIAENHPEITIKMWAHEKEVVQAINTYHVNSVFLPGVEIPWNIIAYTELKEAVEDCSTLIFATPSKVIYDISQKVKKFVPDDIHIGYLTKGFCKIHNEILTISDTLSKVFPLHNNSIVAIYGPSHAEEVSRGYHTCLDVASHSRVARQVFMELLTNKYIGCREADDIRGVDLGATLKNPAAIAAGMISMLPNCGDNLAGVLIVEALGEMLRLGKVLDVKESTLIGICGLGDLVATALSDHSRNRRFGKDIASQIMKKGKSLNLYDRIRIRINPDHVLEKMSERLQYLAEGAYAIEPIIELADRHNISIPVYKALYEILLNKKDPALLIETVKKPQSFDEIIQSTKIITTKKKRGMEHTKGTVFKKTIIRKTLKNFFDNPDLLEKTLEFKSKVEERRKKPQKLNKLMEEFTEKEYKLYNNLDSKNLKGALRDLSRFYLDDISDNFHLFWYSFVMKCIKILNIYKIIFGKRFNRGLFESNVKITGNVAKIRKINDTSNIVYVSTYRSCFDFAYINMSIAKYGFHIPRFCFEKRTINTPFKRFVIKLIGGYIIDFSRLLNPAYQEVARNYLATLIEHGVPIVFFPEIRVSRDGSIGTINQEFLSMIMNALFENTEEIALVPLELSYFKKPKEIVDETTNTLSLRNMLAKRVDLNFSNPIFASDYSNGKNSLSDLATNIDSSWKSDSSIFPHYVFCRIIKENNYQFNVKNADGYIEEFLAKFNGKIKYNSKEILKKGTSFIIKSKIGELKDDEIIIKKTEDIDYYSNMLN